MSDYVDFTKFGGQRVVRGDGTESWQFGWFNDPVSRELARNRIVGTGQPVSFYDAAPQLRGYGAGKSVNLYSIFKAAFGYELPSQYQNRGTCFPAGTTILMADGTEKPIESVAVGDDVVSHTGIARKVLDVGCRSYTGSLVSLTVQGSIDPVRMTAEHPVAIYPNVQNKGQHGYRRGKLSWEAAESVAVGDRVLMPSGPDGVRDAEIDLADFLPDEPIARLWKDPLRIGDDLIRTKGSPMRLRRKVLIDSSFGRLIGLYLAEGCIRRRKVNDGLRPSGITFTYGSDEEMLAVETVALLDRVFGVDAYIVRVPSKHVIRVRCDCAPVAFAMHSICPGDVYTKRVPDAIYRADLATRMSCLRGWLDGDGHLRSDKTPGAIADQTHCVLIGVTSSSALARSMRRLALSCGIHPSVYRRRQARAHRPAAMTVNFYGTEATSIYPERSEMAFRSIADRRPTQYVRVPEGFLCKVKATDSIDVVGLPVYNLEVEEDHSYVADGIAVHNCVSRGMKRVQELLLGLMRYCGNPAELKAENLVSHAFIYGSSRKHGGMLGNQDGSVGAWAAWTVTNEGTLLNSDCGDTDNDDALAVQWGYAGPPSEFVTKAKIHLVKKIVQLNSVEEARDFLCAGLGAVTVASDVGFQTTRNAQGICRRSGSWSHQMHYGGWDDVAGAFAQGQSWGPDNPGGPRFKCAGDDCPSYVFGTLAEDAAVQIQNGDTWGVSWMVVWDAPALTWRP